MLHLFAALRSSILTPIGWAADSIGGDTRSIGNTNTSPVSLPLHNTVGNLSCEPGQIPYVRPVRVLAGYGLLNNSTIKKFINCSFITRAAGRCLGSSLLGPCEWR